MIYPTLVQELLGCPTLKPRIQDTKKLLLLPADCPEVDTIKEDMVAMNKDSGK